MTTNKDELNKLANITIATELFFELLEATYPDVRLFLNNIEKPPTVDEIIKEWPIITNSNAIDWHFQKLTGKDITNLTVKMIEKSDRICNHLNKKHKIVGKGTTTIECLSNALCQYFKEDITTFWKKVENFNDTESAKSAPTTPLITSPIILEIGNGNGDFAVVMEQRSICKSHSVARAFEIMTAYYFILNLEYPKEVSCFMEFIHFLKIQPEYGSKSKNSKTKQRVITLMKNLPK
ncbi:hypothetical protein ILUMI_01405 [Ignelater luminosus]|uniref:Uncharacterized protein n=1 Tax=Ignelater luminosus TaxID=2038154 RepID=A0A8K0GLR7_IGNLU|nr:hypothetical protein ILUMI_01405 [Ignelater luminosus]